MAIVSPETSWFQLNPTADLNNVLLDNLHRFCKIALSGQTDFPPGGSSLPFLQAASIGPLYEGGEDDESDLWSEAIHSIDRRDSPHCIVVRRRGDAASKKGFQPCGGNRVRRREGGGAAGSGGDVPAGGIAAGTGDGGHGENSGRRPAVDPVQGRDPVEAGEQHDAGHQRGGDLERESRAVEDSAPAGIG